MRENNEKIQKCMNVFSQLVVVLKNPKSKQTNQTQMTQYTQYSIFLTIYTMITMKWNHKSLRHMHHCWSAVLQANTNNQTYQTAGSCWAHEWPWWRPSGCALGHSHGKCNVFCTSMSWSRRMAKGCCWWPRNLKKTYAELCCHCCDMKQKHRNIWDIQWYPGQWINGTWTWNSFTTCPTTTLSNKNANQCKTRKDKDDKEYKDQNWKWVDGTPRKPKKGAHKPGLDKSIKAFNHGK